MTLTTPTRLTDVPTIDRWLWAKVERGDRFRHLMALNEWVFRAKHIPDPARANGA